MRGARFCAKPRCINRRANAWSARLKLVKHEDPQKWLDSMADSTAHHAPVAESPGCRNTAPSYPRAIADVRPLAAGLFQRLDQEEDFGGADPRPGLHHIRRVGQRHRLLVQEPSPFHEVLLDLTRAVSKICTRPDGVFFQIPSQLLRLDRADGSNETPCLRAVNVRLARRRPF